jgi:hypothetical protein
LGSFFAASPQNSNRDTTKYSFVLRWKGRPQSLNEFGNLF